MGRLYLYHNGQIINNSPIIKTILHATNFSNSGEQAIQNVGGYLDFVEYPPIRTWSNSYIDTGIKANTGYEIVFHIKESLNDFEESTITITASSNDNICIVFDNSHWDDTDTRNKLNSIWVSFGIPLHVGDGNNMIGGNWSYPRYTPRPIDKISEIWIDISDVAGDIEAIGDWFNSTRYVKDDIDSFFRDYADDSLSAYRLSINDTSNTDIDVTGNVSQKEYKVNSGETGFLRTLMFFDLADQITLNDGVNVKTQSLSGRDVYIRLNIGKNYLTYGSNIVNKRTLESYDPGKFIWSESVPYIPDDGVGFYVDEENGVIRSNSSFPTIRSDDYMDSMYGIQAYRLRMSYIRTGMYIDASETKLILGINGTDVPIDWKDQSWYDGHGTGEIIVKFTQEIRGKKQDGVPVYTYYLWVSIDIIPFDLKLEDKYTAYDFKNYGVIVFYEYSSSPFTLTVNDLYLRINAESLIPEMTSNTTPSGNVIYEDIKSDAYKIFDEDDETYDENQGENVYGMFGYEFENAVTIHSISVSMATQSMAAYYKDFDFDVYFYYSGAWNKQGDFKLTGTPGEIPSDYRNYEIRVPTPIKNVTKVKVVSKTLKTNGNGWRVRRMRVYG